MAPFDELQVLWQNQPEAAPTHFDAAAAAGAFRRYGRRQDTINIAKSIALIGVTMYSVASMRHRPLFLFAVTLILFSAVLALITEWRNQRAIASFNFSAPSVAFVRGAIARLQQQRNPFHTREFAILFGAVFVGYNLMVVASYGRWSVPQRAIGHAVAVFMPAMIYVFARYVRAKRWEAECRPLVERLTVLLETLEERAPVNGPLILNLVGLRYKLLWAKTRSRNGRIALFLSGYLLLLMLFALMAFGGFGAAMAAVQAGKALVIAQAVLMGLFTQAVISTNILGFGMSTVFSEIELRRYPLTATDRRLARHLTGILDPFWFLFFFLELGLALGLYGMGAAGFGSAVSAVLLLFVCNYLCARVVGAFVDRMMKRKGGSAILLALVMALAVLPGPMATLFKKYPELGGQLVQRAAYTPPFAAASAMVLSGGAALGGFAALLGWIAVFTAVLVWIEKRPHERQAAVSVKVTWESWFDRAGAFFGPALGPFVAHWLRFYSRNARTRTMGMLSIPLAAFLTYSTSRSLGPDGLFVAALGTISMATFLGTSRIAVNQFGYSGGAFRRYFLLPAQPAITLRAASYAALVLGAAAIPVALALWTVLAPGPFDARRVAMLMASGLTGLFLFNAAGLWITLYNPRKGNYDSNFGNDLSLGGNVVLIGSMICAMLLPRALRHFYPAAVSPESWLAFLPLPMIAAAVYRGSLQAAGKAFAGRREKLLAVVEGRD